VLFGDGAAAVLLEEVREPFGIVDIIIGSDGRFYELLNMPAGGSAIPATKESVENHLHYLHMNGAEVFKIAVKHMSDITNQLLKRNRLRASDLTCFIAHQANLRIIEATAKRLGLKPNQVYNNIDHYGNTTSATIPSALYDAEAMGKIKRGSWVLCVTFGAGLTWGGALMRWAARPLAKHAAISDGHAVSGVHSEQLRPGRDWER
jgi:3-oxoacyl-[acyl-carrier-protein] synthase-3